MRYAVRLLVACAACKRQYDASGRPEGTRFHCGCGELVVVPKASGHSAAVVRCSSCGAPREGGAEACTYCGASFTLHERDLHTICPQCMARVSDRAQYCHHCATPLVPESTAGEQTDRGCPTCGKEAKLVSRKLGGEEDGLSVLECGGCAGLWLGAAVFRVLQRRAREDAVPLSFAASTAEGDASGGGGTGGAGTAPSDAPFYRACPECDNRMLRRNYAQRSGVIIDHCADHGVWFDAGELHRIVTWLREGGRADPAAAAGRPRRRKVNYGRSSGAATTSRPLEHEVEPNPFSDFVDGVVSFLSGW